MEYAIEFNIAQTCLICQERVTGETKAFTSQCKYTSARFAIEATFRNKSL